MWKGLWDPSGWVGCYETKVVISLGALTFEWHVQLRTLVSTALVSVCVHRNIQRSLALLQRKCRECACILAHVAFRHSRTSFMCPCNHCQVHSFLFPGLSPFLLFLFPLCQPSESSTFNYGELQTAKKLELQSQLHLRGCSALVLSAFYPATGRSESQWSTQVIISILPSFQRWDTQAHSPCQVSRANTGNWTVAAGTVPSKLPSQTSTKPSGKPEDEMNCVYIVDNPPAFRSLWCLD